jgi:hypothetical protein
LWAEMCTCSGMFLSKQRHSHFFPVVSKVWSLPLVSVMTLALRYIYGIVRVLPAPPFMISECFFFFLCCFFALFLLHTCARRPNNWEISKLGRISSSVALRVANEVDMTKKIQPRERTEELVSTEDRHLEGIVRRYCGDRKR